MQADVERLMARLMTDRALRERFVADPAAVARESGLSPQEAEAIGKIPVADLLTAARSYDFKRAAKHRGVRTHPLLAWWRARRP
jgi:Aromatic-ring-opening dioxygenase LigAB, LigA subunit